MQRESRLVIAWYLARLVTVNAIAPISAVWAPEIAANASATQQASGDRLVDGFECSSALTQTFAPAAAAIDPPTAYEVCQSNAALADVIPTGWSAESLNATDVFTAADPRVKRAVGLLYAGRQPQVARGWIARQDALESVTLISPRPDPSLTRLVAGTLLIRVMTRR